MATKSLVLVYHPGCKASIDLLLNVKKLKDIKTEFINIAEDQIETELDIDTVPLIILDNSEDNIFVGKDAFDQVEKISNSQNDNVYGKTGSSVGLKYNSPVTFIEDEDSKNDKKDSIDLSAKITV